MNSNVHDRMRDMIRRLVQPDAPPLDSKAVRAALSGIGTTTLHARINAGHLIEPLRIRGRDYWLLHEPAASLRADTRNLDAEERAALLDALREARVGLGWLRPGQTPLPKKWMPPSPKSAARRSVAAQREGV